MTSHKTHIGRLTLPRALAAFGAAVGVLAIFSGCNQSPTADTSTRSASGAGGQGTTSKSTSPFPVKPNPKLEASLMAAAQTFAATWPPKPDLVKKGEVLQRGGKWLRTSPATMIVRDHHVETENVDKENYMGHVVYEEKCKVSHAFATREQAEAAPPINPVGGLISVNFSYKNGHWVDANGI